MPYFIISHNINAIQISCKRTLCLSPYKEMCGVWNVVYYNTRTCFSKFMTLSIFHCLRYLDETLRISRPICDQYDPEVGIIFEHQKRSYGQKIRFFKGIQLITQISCRKSKHNRNYGPLLL